ncbi:MAG: glycosyl transferase family 2 [Frankiales bacterium]|nr:glycosyl transferase family 2 [Frankiales bacterium]
MGVSVVVPTVDRVELLDRCLAALEAQTVPADEVLVVHDGDPDVEKLLLGWQDRLPLRCLEIKERGASAKRNAGWRAAQHHLVAFTDDDCAPMPGWVEALSVATGDLLAGPVSAHPDDSQTASVFGRTIEIEEPGPYFPAANIAITRTLLARVGGFDPELAAGEDTDLAWRVREAGGSVEWVQQAHVHHAVRPRTFPEHLRSLWRWRDLALVVRRHPELRATLPAKVFWKASHPEALLALIGVVGATRKPVLGLLAAPLLIHRWSQRGLRFGTQVAVADVAEVGVVLAGSVKHRSVLL